MSYIYLAIAILSEVIATASLKASNGFTNLFPSLIVLVGYSVSFYFLSLVLKVIPVGVSYAIWSGVGIVLISIISFVFYGQRLDGTSIIGIGFITVGVMIIQFYSISFDI